MVVSERDDIPKRAVQCAESVCGMLRKTNGRRAYYWPWCVGIAGEHGGKDGDRMTATRGSTHVTRSPYVAMIVAEHSWLCIPTSSTAETVPASPRTSDVVMVGSDMHRQRVLHAAAVNDFMSWDISLS